jgi:DNA-binding NtrC family response regulator
LVGKLQNVYMYLVKPFTPDQIEKLVLNALNNQAPSPQP